VTETNKKKRPAAQLGPEARQKTIDLLCEAFARDELVVEEFEQRVELVHRADNMDQLRVIVADLPSANPPVKSHSRTPVVPYSEPPVGLAPRPTLPPESMPEHSVVVGILGGGGRSGAWVPARQNWVAGVLGGCTLDFREAQLGPGVTEVRVFVVCGGVEILVPPDVRVECSGIGILGGFDHQQTLSSTTDPEAPVIRVTGVAIMGGASVSVRYPGETARDARLRLKAKKKALRQIARGK